MVNITYNPIKEISIDEIVKYSTVKDYVNRFLPALKSGAPVFVRWAEGVLFDYNCYPPAELILKKRLEGILHVDFLNYALMPKYEPFKIIEPPEGGTFYLGVTDVSKTTNLLELARWIKEYDKDKK